MKETGEDKRKHWVAAAYLLWTGALVWLLVTGRYQVFLRPGFWALLLWALAILVLFAGALFLSGRSFSLAGKGPAPWARLGVLIVPLVYLVVAQEQPLGSHALGKRFFEPRYLERFSGGGRGFVDSDDPRVTLLDILQEFRAYEGKRIETLGMVYRDDTVPDGHFLLFRFIIVCCAADAMPAGALVLGEEGDSFEQDAWVSVEGVLGLKQVGDLIFPLIHAESITRIDQPKDPYLFPRLF